MKRLKIALIIASLFFGKIPSLKAQDGYYVTVQDLELWNSAALKYKFNKRLSFSLEQQWRLNNNVTQTDQYFTELGFKREFLKDFYVAGGFRFIRDNDLKGKIQGFENHVRYNVDLGYKHDIGRLGLKYQVRYQTKNELGISEVEGDEPNNTLRFKISSDYNIKKWKLDPQLSAEVFNQVNGTEGFNKIRLTLGTSYSFGNIGEFGAFYRMEKDLNVDYPKTSNIIGLEYVKTIKRKKK